MQVQDANTSSASANFSLSISTSPVPSISAISPRSASTAGGSSVTISGDNFLPDATVQFGSLQALSVQVISSTEIQAVTPAEVAGSVSVTVQEPDGQMAAGAGIFAFVAPVQGTVTLLGVIPATQASSGLGFQLNPDNDWEFQMAAAAGATHARFQCSWQSIENQTAPPNDTDEATPFTLNPDCKNGLVAAAKYGLHPTVVAAYGPPYHAILNVTLPAGAPAGATSLNVSFATGVGGDTLASLRAFYDTIVNANGNQITKSNAYAGGLITSIRLTSPTTATLTLASELLSNLPSGSTPYTINEYLYPPPASSNPSDPSVAAYARYAVWLAGQVHASGITGEIEVWNEPPWQGDPWDNRGDYYDTWPGPASPGPQMQGLPNFGFAAALQSQSSPSQASRITGAGQRRLDSSPWLATPRDIHCMATAELTLFSQIAYSLQNHFIPTATIRSRITGVIPVSQQH